jgi:hypothetical protein
MQYKLLRRISPGTSSHGERMSTKPDHDSRVKEYSQDEGFFHIDLLDGLRLTAPLKSLQAGASRLSEDPPPLDWDEGQAPQPA